MQNLFCNRLRSNRIDKPVYHLHKCSPQRALRFNVLLINVKPMKAADIV